MILQLNYILYDNDSKSLLASGGVIDDIDSCYCLSFYVYGIIEL